MSEYIDVIPEPHGHRLDIPLAVTGLNGVDLITGVEAARRLGVAHQAISQAVQRLWRRWDQARPPAGVWMPQVTVAERYGWPDGYTGEGMAATRGFLDVT